MKDGTTNVELARKLVEDMNITLWDRLLYFGASFGISFWVLSPSIFSSGLPLWVFLLAFIPFAFSVVTLGPKAFRSISKDARFMRYSVQRYIYRALRPRPDELKSYPWLAVIHYSTLWLPFISLFITLSLAFLKMRSGEP